MTPKNDALLRAALRGNALFSSTCGIALLAAAGPLAPWLGIPALALRIVGASLLPFAWSLWKNAHLPEVPRGEAWLAVALDFGWVAGSAALLLAELWPLEPAGNWSVILVADFVLLCAVLQALGLWRSRSGAGAQ